MRNLALPFAVFCLASPLAAQDGSEATAARTPESAQQFLSDFFQQGGFEGTITVFHDAGRLVIYSRELHGSSAPVGAVSGLHGKVGAWQIVDRCRSKIDFVDLRSIFAYNQAVYDQSPFSMAYDLNWSKVVGIRRYSKGAVSLKRRTTSGLAEDFQAVMLVLAYKGQEGPAFYLESNEEADRLQFAFTFLKENCALKSESGF